MGVTKLQTWMISCDRCPIVWGTVQRADYPGAPEGWSYASVYDCGLTGYTRTDLLCWNCTQRAERLTREAATASSTTGRPND